MAVGEGALQVAFPTPVLPGSGSRGRPQSGILSAGFPAPPATATATDKKDRFINIARKNKVVKSLILNNGDSRREKR